MKDNSMKKIFSFSMALCIGLSLFAPYSFGAKKISLETAFKDCNHALKKLKIAQEFDNQDAVVSIIKKSLVKLEASVNTATMKSKAKAYLKALFTKAPELESDLKAYEKNFKLICKKIIQQKGLFRRAKEEFMKHPVLYSGGIATLLILATCALKGISPLDFMKTVEIQKVEHKTYVKSLCSEGDQNCVESAEGALQVIGNQMCAMQERIDDMATCSWDLVDNNFSCKVSEKVICTLNEANQCISGEEVFFTVPDAMADSYFERLRYKIEYDEINKCTFNTDEESTECKIDDKVIFNAEDLENTTCFDGNFVEQLLCTAKQLKLVRLPDEGMNEFVARIKKALENSKNFETKRNLGRFLTSEELAKLENAACLDTQQCVDLTVFTELNNRPEECVTCDICPDLTGQTCIETVLYDSLTETQCTGLQECIDTSVLSPLRENQIPEGYSTYNPSEFQKCSVDSLCAPDDYIDPNLCGCPDGKVCFDADKVLDANDYTFIKNE